jgi:hypothetical protein
MNEHEARRIAAACNRLRPDWPEAQVMTLITEKLMDRPRRDVAVALTWIACEADTATPYRVVEAGPWWKAVGGFDDKGAATTTHTGKTVGRDADPREVCGICDMWRADCEQRSATSGHIFVPRTKCLPPTAVGPLGERGTCLAGPGESPCQLITGHEGSHHCRPPLVSVPPPVTYLDARRGRETDEMPEEGDQ